MTNKKNNQLEPAVDADIIKAMLTNQARELTVREKEAELSSKHRNVELQVHQQEIKSNLEIAKENIQAQERVYTAKLENTNKASKRTHILWGVIVTLLTVFMLIAMYLGKEDFAQQILLAAIAAFGGYGVSKGNQNKNNNNIPSKNDNTNN